MFKALIGDLFESRAQTLVNTVNCVGIMGKGVALEFKKRFPANFKDYAARCERKQVRLGEPYPFRDPAGRLIVNFPTKDHWRSPARLADIERGLDYFVGHYADWGVQSVAMPPPSEWPASARRPILIPSSVSSISWPAPSVPW